MATYQNQNMYRPNPNISGNNDMHNSSMSLSNSLSSLEGTDANDVHKTLQNLGLMGRGTPSQKPFTKIGKIIPNRIFIGGLTPDTTENDLQLVFAEHGRVRSVKIIYDRQGTSKGYGFITFEKVDDAVRLQNETINIIIKNNKIKISKAVKKQHVFDLCRLNYTPTNGMHLTMPLDRLNPTTMPNSAPISPLAYMRALQHHLIPNPAPPQGPYNNSLCGMPPPALGYGGVFVPPNTFPKHAYGKINSF